VKSFDWSGSHVLVTGGASFIGSHLAGSLVRRGAYVTVADDLSSGRLMNLGPDLKPTSSTTWEAESLQLIQGDLRDAGFTRRVLKDQHVVFHLAAIHGGRGFIDTHPADCCTNMLLDQIVLRESHEAGIERFCFASSACVYPTYLQHEAGSSYLLKEEDADPFMRDKAFADLEYGWAKFMGEMAVKAYATQYGMRGGSARIFTAYGPRENETHAIIALIAKAFIRLDPYPIWGSGKQERNFTHVDDIVDGLIATCENVEDGSVVNLGRSDRISVAKAATMIFDVVDWRPSEMHFDTSKPEGVASRAAHPERAKELLGWEPRVSYKEGIKQTTDWYVSTKDRSEVARNLERLLFER
jgi:nucleoside-diphosphate-sugar epimerase